MPPPSTNARTARASFSTTHKPNPTARPHRQQPASSHHNPLSLIGLPWRFLRLTADSGASLPPVLSDAGRQYMAEDAYRWHEQQTAADVVARVPQLARQDTRPQRLSVYGDEKESQADAADEDDDEEAEKEDKVLPLPEFNPFSDTFAVALSPLAADHTTTNPGTADPSQAATPLSAHEPTHDGHEEGAGKKKRGMVAADLLSHFAQKEVVDEERERTRKRERSKWENTSTAGQHRGSTAMAAGAAHSDSGGVMVGGLGLEEDESNSARQARLAVDAEEDERRRRLSAAAEEEGLTAADMPDMSDFIKLYEDEDEPSYPAIIWRQKERLTEAADVPSAVISELLAIDRERMVALSKRAGRSRERDAAGSRGAKRGHERKLTLRFNLGLGKDYEEETEDDVQPPANQASKSKQSATKNRFPTLSPHSLKSTPHNQHKSAKPASSTQAMYGRQWYLPVVQWSTAEEEKERLEAASAERRQQPNVDGAETGSAEADEYHGDGWRDKVLVLKAELPQLYCSKAFKAFLLREREKERDGRGSGGSRGGRRRLPHYLEGVEALDEKKEEEDEQRRAMQAALQAISTPRTTHSTNPSTTTSTRTHSAASTASIGPPANPDPALQPPSASTAAASEQAALASAAVGGEEEREGDLLEYMREVRMRELNLAGLRWIKEREKAMEERERRKKEREKRKARAGGSAAGGAAAGVGGGSGGAGGGSEVVACGEGDSDDEDEVDLDKLFDVPDYPCSLT